MTALTAFEDRDVVSATIRVTNAGDGLSDSMEVVPMELHVGDEVVLVMKTKVKRVAYEPRADTKKDPNPDGDLERVHFLVAKATTIVEERAVAKILAAHAANLKRARDTAAGQGAFDVDDQAEDNEDEDAEPPPADPQDAAWEDSARPASLGEARRRRRGSKAE